MKWNFYLQTEFKLIKQSTNTIMGWIFAGRKKLMPSTFMSDPLTAFLGAETTIPQQATVRDVTHIYKLEKIGIMYDPSTNKDDVAVNHFYKSLKFENNRYSV